MASLKPIVIAIYPSLHHPPFPSFCSLKLPSRLLFPHSFLYHLFCSDFLVSKPRASYILYYLFVLSFSISEHKQCISPLENTIFTDIDLLRLFYFLVSIRYIIPVQYYICDQYYNYTHAIFYTQTLNISNHCFIIC